MVHKKRGAELKSIVKIQVGTLEILKQLNAIPENERLIHAASVLATVMVFLEERNLEIECMEWKNEMMVELSGTDFTND